MCATWHCGIRMGLPSSLRTFFLRLLFVFERIIVACVCASMACSTWCLWDGRNSRFFLGMYFSFSSFGGLVSLLSSSWASALGAFKRSVCECFQHELEPSFSIFCFCCYSCLVFYIF